MKLTRKEILRLMDERREWAEKHPRCWICNATSHAGFPLETHEIEKRSQAPHHKWASLVNYFRVCKKCHMDDVEDMTHAEQLAYKRVYDPENYDRIEWMKLKDPELKAPKRVEAWEVKEAHEKFQKRGWK